MKPLLNEEETAQYAITAGKAYNITYSAMPNEYDDYYFSKIKYSILFSKKDKCIELHYYYYYYKIPWLPLKSSNQKHNNIVT